MTSHNSSARASQKIPPLHFSTDLPITRMLEHQSNSYQGSKILVQMTFQDSLAILVQGISLFCAKDPLTSSEETSSEEEPCAQETPAASATQ